MKPSVNIGRGSAMGWKWWTFLAVVILAVIVVSGMIAYRKAPEREYSEWRIITPMGVYHDSNCISWPNEVSCTYGTYHGNVVLQRVK